MSLFDSLKELVASATAEPERPIALHAAEGQQGRVLDLLRSVIDPEAGLDIVSLGLVRKITVEDDQVDLVMTLTTPGCPVAGRLMAEVEETLAMEGLYPEIHLEFEPPWTAEEVSPEGREQLG